MPCEGAGEAAGGRGPREYEAVLFDMDETLVRSGGLWRAGEERLWAALGSRYDPAVAARYAGSRCDRVAEFVMAATDAAVRPAELSTVAQCADFLRGSVVAACTEGQYAVEAMPGAQRLLGALAARGVPMAVVSGSPQCMIEAVVAALGWSALFGALCSTEQVPRGKPHPDGFLRAAEMLGVRPGPRVLVVEDSLAGATAARAAGMTCWVVPSSSDPAIAQTAHRAFASLDGIAELL
eukprot:m51a1_g6116 hypothetical protein (237) ;mRNA; f:123102-124314